MHSFDPEIAKKVGVNAAVIYQNIVWWTQKNIANNKHYHDGRHWTYNSIKAFDALFPYLSSKQIRTALDKLEDAELILSGVFNRAGYDRTKWYCPNCQIDLPKKANGIAQEGEPIPVSKPVIKPDIKLGEKSPKKQKRAISLPDGWVPSDRNIEDATKRGFFTGGKQTMKQSSSEITISQKDQHSKIGMLLGGHGLETLRSLPDHVPPETAEDITRSWPDLLHTPLNSKTDRDLLELAIF